MRKYFDSAKQKQSSLGQLYREMTGVSTLQSHFEEFRSVSISSYLKVWEIASFGEKEMHKLLLQVFYTLWVGC